ncbi:hypothetical protein GQ42DRAFT_164556 [Ramicandelaber brevisporus]|nr:hypothetical protein GQ42DRAFT_164556 [Ramicandelaber brevisporus]
MGKSSKHRRAPRYRSSTAQAPQPSVSSLQQQAPFRFQDLPLDLKLYVASFVYRSEAAKLLTVNSEYHRLFAHRVWSRLYNLRLPERSTFILNKVTKSAWTNYGHLVRHLRFSSAASVGFQVADCMPNVMTVVMDLENDHICHDYLRQISSMRNLHQLTLSVDNYTSMQAIKTVVEWTNNVSNSGYIDIIRWKFKRGRQSQETLLYVVSHIQPQSLRRHRFDIDVDAQSVSPVIASKSNLSSISHLISKAILSETLVPARVICRGPSISFLINSVHPASPAPTFPLLTGLSIQLCCTNYFDFSQFTPMTFPSLLKLGITIPHQVYCNSSHNGSSASGTTALDKIFSYTWHTVTLLQYNDFPSESEFDMSKVKMPNLSSLFVTHFDCDFDLGYLYSNLQHSLVDLYISGPEHINFTLRQPAFCLRSQQQHVDNIRIRRLKLHQTDVSFDILRFIMVTAPHLRTLSLDDCITTPAAVKDGKVTLSLFKRTSSSPLDETTGFPIKVVMINALHVAFSKDMFELLGLFTLLGRIELYETNPPQMEHTIRNKFSKVNVVNKLGDWLKY